MRNTLIPYVASGLAGMLIAGKLFKPKGIQKPSLPSAITNPLGAAADLAKSKAEAEVMKRVQPQVTKVVVAGVAIGAAIFAVWESFGGKGRG